MEDNIQEPSFPQQKNVLTVPVAIIIAGALIAGAVLWTQKPAKVAVTNPVQNENVLAPVTAKDHILGNPTADLVIVEFSDFSCPFCKMFHPTMRKIMDEYGKTGQVAWVYRSFPLDKPDQTGQILHKNAGHEAEAAECVADLGGNDKFWEYTNKVYEITPSVTSSTPEGLDQSKLPEIAASIGIDKDKFNACLASGKFKDKVEAQYMDGINAGVLGTPFSFILTKDGQKIPLNGAQPYSDVKAAIDTLLKK